jgi:hypothetical protein
VLVGTLRPRCVDRHFVVQRLIGNQSQALQEHRKNLPQVRQLNDTSNLLELPLALRQGRHNTPHKSPGGGQEQVPLLS